MKFSQHAWVTLEKGWALAYKDANCIESEQKPMRLPKVHWRELELEIGDYTVERIFIKNDFKIISFGPGEQGRELVNSWKAELTIQGVTKYIDILETGEIKMYLGFDLSDVLNTGRRWVQC